MDLPIHPGPRVAVLGCRCGAAIDTDQMRRQVATYPGAGPIAPIVCEDCA